MLIEIICTGDEILSGKTVNTNYSHMARRLADVGLAVRWGATVGDDRDTLLAAFRQAGGRADAVIVNGGLGPTVDDLSQEIAARAAGVELALDEAWHARMEAFYTRRGRAMPANNRKQAMLPVGSEFIDNPIGTACGFALTIGRARFFFTPGVPRELRRMLDEQVIPRLLALGGGARATRLKRFHSFGIGESRADEMLAGVEDLAPGGGVKLGFQAHYPQLETKLAAVGDDQDDLARRLAPVEAEVRRRLGAFVVAEDDRTLESEIADALRARGGAVSVAEMFTAGGVAARLAPMEDGERLFRRGIVARDTAQLCAAAGLDPARASDGVSCELAVAAARSLRLASGASHAMAALVELDEGPDRLELGGRICIGLDDGAGADSREARLLGGRDWVRIGAIELALDCLRRRLLGLPVEQRIDFEKR